MSQVASVSSGDTSDNPSIPRDYSEGFQILLLVKVCLPPEPRVPPVVPVGSLAPARGACAVLGLTRLMARRGHSVCLMQA